MINFWTAYKRDFWKIVSAALIAVFLVFALKFFSPSHVYGDARAGNFIATLITNFFYFGFYCALAIFFFESKKGGPADLAAKYFYVPVISAVFYFLTSVAAAYANTYVIVHDLRLTVGKFAVPYSWTPVPFTLLGGFIAVLVLFVFLIAVSKSVSWLKSFEIFLSRFKTLFAAFLWWEFCIGVLIYGALFVSLYAIHNLNMYVAYLNSISRFISLILEAVIIYFVFQKADGAE